MGNGSSNGDSVQSASVELRFSLPKGVDRSEVALSTTSGPLYINDHVKVYAWNDEAHFASVSAVNGGRVSRLGAAAELQDVWSDGDIELANNSRVYGNATTTGLLVPQQGSRVYGDVRQLANIGPLESVVLTVQFPAHDSQIVTLQPNSGVLEIAPGAYAGFVVNRGATLKLSQGTYYFDRLDVGADAALQIDNSSGPVRVYVRDSLALKGTYSRKLSRANVLIGYSGAATVSIEKEIQAIVVASNAEVILATAAGGYYGSFFAKKLTVHQFSAVHHEPWLSTTLCLPDAPCSALCPCDTLSERGGCVSKADCVVGLSCSSAGRCVCEPSCAEKRCGDDLADGCGGQCPGLCVEGASGCKTNADCVEGTVCWEGKGAPFGYPTGTNVCVSPQCRLQDPSKADCGVGGAECGACPNCIPDCNGAG
jgi:hypothetical protein